jgi:DNA-binding winged helix-turn-helix (wHTH) protein
VHLTGKEYQILEILALRKGTTLSKEMFLNHLYGGMDEPKLKIIDVFICKLRKKLANASGDRDYIETTVWGRGYMLREPSVIRGSWVDSPQKCDPGVGFSRFMGGPGSLFIVGSQSLRPVKSTS